MSGCGSCDVLLVGAGLANGLIAWRLRQTHPELRLRLLEREPTIGGRHTWSFHETDLEAAQNAWLAPFVEASWPAYDVRFPGRRRRVGTGYRSLRSERFHRVLASLLGEDALLGHNVREVRADGVTLEDGTRIEARCVIDGRGFSPGPWLVAGVQRFFGLDLSLEGDHGLDAPLLMDADVPQNGGFRFFYLLPWSARHLLVEETLYADDAVVDERQARAEIERYALERGWRIAAVLREERGALPIPLAGDLEALWRDVPEGVACSGMRGAFFHATTGYSLPEAVRVADALAARRSFEGPTVAAELRARSRELWQRQGFLRLLNRMLFRAARPERRHLVLARFYRLRQDSIERFYAGSLTLFDRVRLLVGRPPVPVHRALGCLREPKVESPPGPVRRASGTTTGTGVR